MTPTQGQRLAQEAAEAAEVRTWQTHPDVVALQVEKTRALVDRLMWGAVLAGLAFTMVNVQQFAAHTTGSTPGTLGWWAAWLLDPTIAAGLLGILITERRVAPGQIVLERVARVAKWALLLATYLMNTWHSYASGSVAGVVLHSVPPVVVFVLAEVMPGLHDRLTEYVHWAHAAASERAQRTADAARHEHAEREQLEREHPRAAELEQARHQDERDAIRHVSPTPAQGRPGTSPTTVPAASAAPPGLLADASVTRLTTRGQHTRKSTPAARQKWIHAQLDAGVDVTGADVRRQFPDASNAARDVATAKAQRESGDASPTRVGGGR